MMSWRRIALRLGSAETHSEDLCCRHSGIYRILAFGLAVTKNAGSRSTETELGTVVYEFGCMNLAAALRKPSLDAFVSLSALGHWFSPRKVPSRFPSSIEPAIFSCSAVRFRNLSRSDVLPSSSSKALMDRYPASPLRISQTRTRIRYISSRAMSCLRFLADNMSAAIEIAAATTENQSAVCIGT